MKRYLERVLNGRDAPPDLTSFGYRRNAILQYSDQSNRGMVGSGSTDEDSFIDPDELLDLPRGTGGSMPTDEKTIRQRLEDVRGELLNWDRNDPHGTKAGFTYSPQSYRGHSKESSADESGRSS